MIDRNTGNIKLTDSFELRPKSNFDLLEEQGLGEVREIRDMGNGYKWLDIKNIKVENQYFIIALCFKDEELSEASLVFDDSPFVLTSGWSSRRQQKEKDDLKKYQVWLGHEFGNTTKFKWGEVWTDYDPKGGSSSIRIRYN